jgi:small ligand-binding sensory domain FIST
MKKIVITLAAFAAFVCAGAASSEPDAGSSASSFTAAQMEKTLRTGVNGGGVFFKVSGVFVGPVLAAACRGEGEPYATNSYPRYICAARARNAERLLIVRVWAPAQGEPFRFQLLGWR